MGPAIHTFSPHTRRHGTWDTHPYYRHLVVINGDLFKLVHLTFLVVATEVWLASDGTYPTEMLSCLVFVYRSRLFCCKVITKWLSICDTFPHMVNKCLLQQIK